MSSDFVYQEFLGSYKDNFKAAVTLAFDRIRVQKNSINDLFMLILKTVPCTADQVKYMIEIGANPAVIDDSGDLCSRLISMNTKESADVLRILSANDFELSYDDFDRAVCKRNFIDILVENGYDVSILLEQIACNKPKDIDPGTADFIMEHLSKADSPTPWVLSRLFLILMYFGKLSVDIIEDFVSIGLDLRHDNDLLLVKSCKYKNTNLTSYLIYNYGADINARNGAALYNAINNSVYETVKLLLDLGAIITDKGIQQALFSHPRSTKLLISHPRIDHEQIARVFIIKLLLENKNSKYICKTLLDSGIDFTQIIQSLFKN